MKPATELPWYVHKQRPQLRVVPKGSYQSTPFVADLHLAPWPNAEQDAAYIVHACNLYPELVEALETIANDCELILAGDDMSGMSDTELFGAMLETVNAAIAKAEGGNYETGN